MEPAISSEKQALSQPPLILKPIVNETASVASLVHHTLQGLDRRSLNTTLPTASLDLILKTFLQVIKPVSKEKPNGIAR